MKLKRQKSQKRARKNRAFTLIELLVTISLTIILVTLCIPKLSFFNRSYLQQEVERLFTVFSYIQQKAIASNRTLSVAFDINKHSYSYPTINQQQETHTLPNPITFGYLPESQGPPSRPGKPITQAVSFNHKPGKKNAHFYPDGTISPGAAYLIDEQAHLMQAVTCPIGAVSYVRKYRLEGKRWYIA